MKGHHVAKRSNMFCHNLGTGRGKWLQKVPLSFWANGVQPADCCWHEAKAYTTPQVTRNVVERGHRHEMNECRGSPFIRIKVVPLARKDTNCNVKVNFSATFCLKTHKMLIFLLVFLASDNLLHLLSNSTVTCNTYYKIELYTTIA